MEFKVIKHSPPHDSVTWVEIIVKVKNNKTGEVIEFIDEGILDDQNRKLSTFIWECGDYSCDCNRGIFFYRNKEVDIECGYGGYSVNIYNSTNKELLYKEFEELERG